MDIYSQIENVLYKSSPSTFISDLNSSFKDYTFTVKTDSPDILTILGSSRLGNLEFEVGKSNKNMFLIPSPWNPDTLELLKPVDLLDGGFPGTL